MKKLLSVFLSLVTLVGIASNMFVPASAASTTAYDILSTSKYAKVYTLSSSGITIPYTSKELTARGSVTRGRSSGAYIDNKADELYLCDVGKTNGTYWAYVSYPSGSSRSYAYIPLSAISNNNGSHAKTVASGKFYCAYRSGVGTSTSYYVDKGDAVYLLNVSGSQCQIMYPVSGNKMRIAFCSKSDYERYCGSVSTGGSGNMGAAVKSVSLRYTSYTLPGKGTTVSLMASVSPSNAANKTLTWKSSNNSVAKVDALGKVTAVGAGTATITATANNGKKATATITVGTVYATKVKLNYSSFTLNGTGATKKLTATVTPSTYSGTINWRSSNSTVAKVDQSGRVTAVGNGMATIVAIAENGEWASANVTCKGCNNWDSKVGSTVARIKNGSSYTQWYGSSGNLSARGGYTGQCTWYAYGRFYELTGIQLKTANAAKRWLRDNNDDSRVKVVYGASSIVDKSVAVCTSGSYGHVMFIEHVTRDSKGNPQYVYFTECNMDMNGRYDAGKECILQKWTYSKFVSNRNPAGYIVAR